ncbi:MAG TPA: cell surface protein SprA, partial [candidate division Zixibacteria bacterium]|nr:cell surface protein SprA [candidate division Zixibacteria bacterium]
MKRSLLGIFPPILLLFIAVSTPSVCAQIGFQASLYTPPSFVSPWVEPKDQFSVALYPKTYALLSPRLKRMPRATYSNFDQDYIRFETKYYNRGRNSESLIPVAVDAQKYSAYRRESAVSDMFSDASARSLTQAQKRGGAGGLGINVALPKRLDKIFGEGGAGLKVSGFRRISFAGRSTWTDASATDAFQQSKFPSLSMEQVSRFDITGNIGSKITVKVSQDSQTDIPLANSLQIRYKGDDDDILKSIEAGNTTLSLPNTQFVGYSSRIQGLFGVKAEAQIGGLTLTGIASQEKGSTERASFSPTGEEGAKYVRDYEYVQRRIFDLGRPGELQARDSVITVFVYESETRSDNREADFADLFVNPNYPDSFVSENVLSGDALRYTQISTDYTIYNEPERNRHYIVFNSQRSTNNYLGVWMVVKRYHSATSSYTTDTVGNINSIPYKLKLLCKPESVARPTEQTWGLMWRNCYAIDHDVKVQDIDLKIYKGLPGTEGNGQNYDYETVGGQTTPYLQVLGMDQYNTSDKKVPDLLLDNRQEVFRPDWGLIIFPNRTPFASDTTFTDDNKKTTPVLQELVPSVYNYSSYDDKTNASEYYLQLTTKVRSSNIKLNRANIIEGSEKITLNGRQLVRGTDYNIQYDFGQITLLTDEANDPNANLSIDYEYAPFFAVQKKSLLGTRAEYAFNKNFKIGSTFLYKSDKAQDRKPKVGQETAKMLVYDADMSLKLQPNFLTKAANALPLVETTSPSNLSLTAEVAQSHPNPNVNDAAYIDDFETALDQLSLGTTRTSWKRAPRPLPLNADEYQRGKVIWYSPENFIPFDSVYKGERGQGNNTVRIMRLVFRPDHNKVAIDTTVTPPDTTVSSAKSWGGI